MAALPITAQVPLFADPYGTLRAQGTRVTLDSIVTAFRAGATAEEIAQKFPSVSLADVYLIISHYLHHAAEIDFQRTVSQPRAPLRGRISRV
jgi:uncharacterized protein (DUF433 family)